MSKINIHNNAFTIVELLVVVVIIGILASIIVVSYADINNRAIVAGLQSDLSGASKQLKLFNVDTGIFPATVSVDCSTNPTSDTNLCLNVSEGNTLDYTRPTLQSFNLEIADASSSVEYFITENSSPSSTWIAGKEGTVIEDKTIYYQNSPIGYENSYFKWADAVSACASIGARLPSITELQSIAADRTVYNNNFFGTSSVSYWSGTEVDDSTAWRLIFWINTSGDFSSITTGTIGKTFNLDAARCIKD